MNKLSLQLGEKYRTRSNLIYSITDVFDVQHAGATLKAYIGLRYPLLEIGTKSEDVVTAWFEDGRHILHKHLDFVEEYRTPIEFNWDSLPKWANGWICMHKDGSWYVHQFQPMLCEEDGTFRAHPMGYSILIPEDFAPKNYHEDWTRSLRRNPNKPIETC